MKSIVRRIDRFCLTHPNFGIRNLMIYIITGNVLVWIFTMMDKSGKLFELVQFSAEKIFTRGQVWRLVTFIFVPTASTSSFRALIMFAFVMYCYYQFGKLLEHYWGAGKFTIFYLSGVLFNIIFGTVIWLITGKNLSIDTFYLNFTLYFAFATLFPDTMVLLFGIIPLKAKWIAYAEAAYFAYMMISEPFPVNLLPLIAVLNYLIFCGSWLFDMVRPSRIQQKQKTINFKKAAKKYNREQAAKPYNRKCEVCGRTDRDSPNLEFRFCSKCGGYHCFCADHINSHVHFKE
jgi:membrane associated rhomboid family serine protease